MLTKILPCVSSKSCERRLVAFAALALGLATGMGTAGAAEADSIAQADAAAGPSAASAPAEPSDTAAAAAPASSGDAAGAAPSSSADVVELIDASGEAPKPAAPPATERFEVHGWARQSLELGFWRHGLHSAEPNDSSLAYDRLLARTQLFARARYARGEFFEVNVSGLLSYAFAEQGPDRYATSFNGFNGQATSSSYEASLHELFLGFFWHRFDLRIGQQRVAWGRADFYSPNDVVNPRDNRDPFLAENELRFVPTPLVRGDLNFDTTSLELVVSPFFVPDRGDLVGTNWAGMQPDAPTVLRNFVNGRGEEGLSVRLPATGLSQPTAGARLTWSTGGWDVAHYYHYGFDGPVVGLDPAVHKQLSSDNLQSVSVDEVPILNDAVDSGAPPFAATFVRRHHVGVDAATTFGSFALRFDAAYQSQRVFYREDLLSFVSPATLAVASLEYQTGEREKGFLVEALYVHISHRSPVPLLSYARDTIGVASVLRWKLFDYVSGELRAVTGLQPQTLVIQPLLIARLDSWSVSIGGLWLGGTENSLGHYFRRNRELFARAKYSF